MANRGVERGVVKGVRQESITGKRMLEALSNALVGLIC